MRRRISIPDDFYFHLAKGEESLRGLGKRFGVSERTIRRWRDEKAEKGCRAEIRKDLEAPLCLDASLTFSIAGVYPWRNRLKTLDICRRDQVWVSDITYVRLKGHFVYVALLMDVFTRMIRRWKLSQRLTQSLTLKPLQEALRQRGSPEIPHSDQGVNIFQVLTSRRFYLNLKLHFK